MFPYIFPFTWECHDHQIPTPTVTHSIIFSGGVGQPPTRHGTWGCDLKIAVHGMFAEKTRGAVVLIMPRFINIDLFFFFLINSLTKQYCNNDN